MEVGLRPLVRHKPTKWISDNRHCYNVYIHIYVYVYLLHVYVCLFGLVGFMAYQP